MATEPADEKAANVDAAHQEALDYWGYLIKDDKCGTDTLDRLLHGIADVISTEFEPTDSPDLTPSQLSAFYRHVGGNYDVLFIDTPPSSIAFIYRSLGAFHSLQPGPDDDGYVTPTIPALKKRGFVTWQTIQLLLGPEEHVPFLQRAVELFDVVDPKTRTSFPKILPKECFPDRPDDAMEAWYQGVAERLKREAEEDALEKENVTHVRVEVDSPGPGLGPGPRNSSDMSGEGSADDRHGAFKYFEDPLYRKERQRPTFVRRFSKAAPMQYVEDRGRLVAQTVRHMWNPFKDRRRNVPGRYEDDSYSDEDATPIAPPIPVPVAVPLYSHKRPHPPRRESSLSSTDSESDHDRSPARHRDPAPLRHRRSHEPATSPREYFPPAYDARRYSQDEPIPVPANIGKMQDGPPPLYGPTKSPLFATHVAQLQAHNYYERSPRPAMPARTSYRPHNPGVRYTVTPPDPREADMSYVRDSYSPSGSSRHRRRSEEHPRERDRDREKDSLRTRSHDRVKDDWDDRDRSSDRKRKR
ncbi:hypothetical protein BCR34DRAFT_55820 [Clohesyomyces aquaticus]|uniref:DUF7514 domain-containing protein n=1 Tax=Clohesyomyces aquaticus TaxID=1231657 RepID=A0A1Y1Z2P7_9PLEO|nr:hypothetical protein BCR34DRAFT_55820 [Clohesyomyces aquaticus]